MERPASPPAEIAIDALKPHLETALREYTAGGPNSTIARGEMHAFALAIGKLRNKLGTGDTADDGRWLHEEEYFHVLDDIAAMRAEISQELSIRPTLPLGEHARTLADKRLDALRQKITDAEESADEAVLRFAGMRPTRTATDTITA